MYIGFSKYLFKAIGTVLAITALTISCNELDDFNTEFGSLHQGFYQRKNSLKRDKESDDIVFCRL